MPENARQEEDLQLARALEALAETCHEDPEVARSLIEGFKVPETADRRLGRALIRATVACEEDGPFRREMLELGRRYEEHLRLEEEGRRLDQEAEKLMAETEVLLQENDDQLAPK
jgi:hypothetical protein